MRGKKLLRLLVSTGLMALSASSLAFAADAGVHVDQVGYLTGHDKVAMVTAKGEKNFRLVDIKTNQTVYEGKLSKAKFDENAGEEVCRADFTAFETPGEYKLVVGERESYDFAIGDNVYAVPMVQNLRSYTLARSNNPLEDELTGLKIEKGHPQTAAAEVYFTDKLNQKGDKVDVTGGWYDAGDYGKYITTAAISSAELMLAYEAHPDHFTKGQLFFPKGVKADKSLPDVLTEVKWELDWMRKMQRQDGSTFHKVAGAKWPGFDATPDNDDQPFYLYSTCSSSTAMYGASLAMAARVYQAYEPAYAQALLKDAKKVWAFLSANPEPFYRVDEGQESGSGPYNKDKDAEERLWLAAELFKTTGDKVYEKYLQEKQAALLAKKPSFFTWDDTQILGQYAYCTAKGAEAGLKAKAQKALLAYADELCKKIEKDGFDCALAKSEYTWASTKNALTMGDILLMANELAPKQAYVEGALNQVHYLFGRNVLNKSFMTGVGDNPPEHPHNRIHESTGAYVPGLVVGGPNFVSGGDPDQTKYLEENKVAPARAYLDVLSSWSTNEYAIDYNASAAYALAWFAKAEPSMKAEQLKISRQFAPVVKGQSLAIDFKQGTMPQGFEAAHGWTNGNPFNVNWYSKNVTFKNGNMQLVIDNDSTRANDVPYSGGEFRSKDFYGYGRYECSLKAIKNDGVVSSFFTYTGPSDNNPWDEIDVEVLGKDTTKVQFNYFRDGKGDHEYMYDLGFDASEDFHTYAFEWHKDCIIWYVDGKEAYRADKSIPVTKAKIMMNAWAGKNVDEWLKAFDDKKLPLQAEYQWVKYTPFSE